MPGYDEGCFSRCKKQTHASTGVTKLSHSSHTVKDLFFLTLFLFFFSLRFLSSALGFGSTIFYLVFF